MNNTAELEALSRIIAEANRGADRGSFFRAAVESLVALFGCDRGLFGQYGVSQRAIGSGHFGLRDGRYGKRLLAGSQIARGDGISGGVGPAIEQGVSSTAAYRRA